MFTFAGHEYIERMNRVKDYIHNSLRHIYPPAELKNLAEIIFREVLMIPPVDILLHKDIDLSLIKKQELDEVLLRLRQHEPVQYVLGKAFFYGMEFGVEPGVLVPRPETEELVEMILAENPGRRQILDIGTGSGCIAIALAKKNREAEVEAWDVSDTALDVARRNSERLAAGVHFRKVDVLEDIGNGAGKYHIIASNPPYITGAEREDMDKNVLQWEPELALFVPDDDPLLFYRRIAALGRDALHTEGRIYFEINPLFDRDIVRLMEGLGYGDVSIRRDLSGKNRFVTAAL